MFLINLGLTLVISGKKNSPVLLNDIIEMFCPANLPTKTVAFDKCFSELFFNHKG